MTTTKKTIALLSTSALAAGAAHGAVLYTNINITLSEHGALALDLNQDGTPDFQLAFNASAAAKPYITNAPPTLTTPAVLSATSTQGLPVTTSGTTINGSYETTQPVGYFNKNDASTPAVVGSWTAAGNVEGYVGLKLTDGAGLHYGWAHLIYNATNVPANNKDTATLTLVDAAMETTPNTAIQAGQTAETGNKPVVTGPPSSQTGYLGGTVQLTVNAVGFPAPTFQWQAGPVGLGTYTNLPNGAGVTDGANNTLTLQNLKLANMADYVVVVSNSSGAVTSSVPATLTVVSASDSPATLVHRYSFQDLAGSGSFADSVGGPVWAGTPEGTANLTGSSLVLDGSSGCFGLLPSNITSNYTQMTVECWVDIGMQSANWARIFSFGNQTGGGGKQSGVDYSPNAAGGYQNVDFEDNNSVDAYANNNTALTNTTGTHITVVVDSVNRALYYYNGTNVVSTLNTAVPSLANISDVYNLIGASLVAVDPYLAGTFHEFRIYQGVLPAQAVALNDVVGPAYYFQLAASPTISAINSGGNIVLSWPASDYNFAVQSTPGVGPGNSWTTLTNAPALVGTNWQVSLPDTGTAKFYQLIYK
jgi:hypothetical protein